MTSNIGNYQNSALLSTRNAAAERQENRISKLFGRRDAETELSDNLVSGKKDRDFSRLYTIKGMLAGARVKEKPGTFTEKSSVQRALDKINREAYRDWKDTALYNKMSLVSQLFAGRDEESESADSALYRKEVSEISKPYPAKDMLVGERGDSLYEKYAAPGAGPHGVSQKESAAPLFGKDKNSRKY